MTLLVSIITTLLLINPWGTKDELQVTGYRLQVEENSLQVPRSGLQVEESPKFNTDQKISPSLKDSSIKYEADQPESDLGTGHIKTDTVINGIIIELNKAQLKELGFHISDGYYYLNELPDGSHVSLSNYYKQTPLGKGGEYGFFRIGDYRQIERLKSLTASHYDFYPQAITNLNGIVIDQVIRNDKINPDEFEEINDKLMPILFRYSELGGMKKQDMVIWFKISESFIDVLKNLNGINDKELEFAETILDESFETTIDYNFEIKIEDFDGLKLDKNTLECLGFSISDSSLDYKYEHQGDWITFFYNQTGLGHNNLSLSKFKNLQDSLKLIESPPLLCGMTDFLGKYHITLPSFEDISNEGISGDFFDYCIPIQMCEIPGLPNIEKTKFWFYPNERFFSCLPDSIGEPMRKEFNYHKSRSGIVDEIIIEDFVPTETEEVPCEYFPSFCEGLPGLEDVNIYPNPAEDQINIDIILGRAKTIDFRIFDLSGRLILDDHPQKIYDREGRYRETMDISSLTPGLFLLVLTDDEGARMTRRIVKN